MTLLLTSYYSFLNGKNAISQSLINSQVPFDLVYDFGSYIFLKSQIMELAPAWGFVCAADQLEFPPQLFWNWPFHHAERPLSFLRIVAGVTLKTGKKHLLATS